MKSITIIINKKMKMSDLIDADYHLLLLLERLSFSLGFGDKSIEEVCIENEFDADCFVFLANYQSSRATMNVEKQFSKLPLQPFLIYLKKSHSYFLDRRLPNIRRKLELILVSLGNEKLQNVILNFFDNYTKEVFDHMTYENDVVFPYIYKLLNRDKSVEQYSIGLFEDKHNDIEGKMTDLKQILLKYVSWCPDQMLMANILLELYTSAEELESHTFIEDELVIPRVKKMEELIS